MLNYNQILANKSIPPFNEIVNPPLADREIGKDLFLPKVSKYLYNSNLIGSAKVKTNETVEKFQKEFILNKNKTIEKYQRKSIAQFTLAKDNTNKQIEKTNKSLCSCGRDTHFMNEEGVVIVKETAKGKRHGEGLKSCGSAWVCPTCASKLSTVRGSQLKEMLDIGRDNNRTYIMSVLTVPHYVGDNLDYLMEMLNSTYHYVYNSKKWKDFKKDLELNFVHSGLEIMASFKNDTKGNIGIDWHPHKNLLLDFAIPMEKIKEKIQFRLGLKNKLEGWQVQHYIADFIYQIANPYIKKHYNRELKVPFLENKKIVFKDGGYTNKLIVKGGVSCSVDFKSDYPTKWGLEVELTAGIYKNGQFEGASFHPFVLLDFISKYNDKTDDKFKEKCIKAFKEYTLATKGKSFFRFAKNSKEFYDLEIENDLEELQKLDSTGKELFSISENDWTLFKPTPMKLAKLFTLENKAYMIDYLTQEIENNKNCITDVDDSEVEIPPPKDLLEFDKGIYLKENEIPF